ncbi:RNA 2',3'-cyclic phosphodiesterase [Photobacterium sp. GJ3]|uniref:RNA 2',3'-cyclic phosphodiesterase n=1 Tax=Photobacterium sp. GJ3 TaxID=2829502 RepID=UPI001B8CC860|nr:RNA 2',3'-cyclic phosphodiesterase [Photobacterium sp. GJ3]QUJ67050.1 RNA 2',3'-cyclic phosphodiesterase [Photobacterium sp. GJ3]
MTSTDAFVPNEPAVYGQQTDGKRMFFALPLTEPPAENLQPYQQLCHFKDHFPGRGRVVPDANLHLTLAFLGQVTEAQQQQLIQATEQLTIPAFNVVFNFIRYWKRSRVIWMGAEQSPPALLQLAEQLGEIAEATGLPRDTRQYTPHITLKKNVRQRPVLDSLSPDFHFHFQRFGLYISEVDGPGVRYRLVNQWPLHHASQDSP